MKIREIFFLLFLLIVLVFFKIITQNEINTSTSSNAEAWVFPNVIINILICVVIFLSILNRKKIFEAIEIHNYKIVFMTIAISIISFLIWRYIHFILGITLFIIALGYLYKVLARMYIVASVITSVFLYFILVYVFNILL